MQSFRLLKEIRAQNRFILNEFKRVNETIRYQMLGDFPLSYEDVVQTHSSFDYQWGEISNGIAMSDDQKFMEVITSLLCKITDLSESWFPGKKVVDAGCGGGRFSYGLLALGATVVGCDQSLLALDRTRDLCRPYADRLSTKQVDLLKWEETETYDLIFCFGVVHHTGNTYLGIRNLSRKVKKGGRLFLMVYGFPETYHDFMEINQHETLRSQLHHLTFEEKRKVLVEKFGPYLAHGWFDATSPRINDLLTFDEIATLLTRLGFKNVKRTMPGRNHHIVADKT